MDPHFTAVWHAISHELPKKAYFEVLSLMLFNLKIVLNISSIFSPNEYDVTYWLVIRLVLYNVIGLLYTFYFLLYMRVSFMKKIEHIFLAIKILNIVGTQLWSLV